MLRCCLAHTFPDKCAEVHRGWLCGMRVAETGDSSQVSGQVLFPVTVAAINNAGSQTRLRVGKGLKIPMLGHNS